MDFEALYLKYHPVILRYAYSLTRNRAEAEDLAQDTFEHALRAYGRFDGANPGGWLYRICFNLFAQQRRHNRLVALVPLALEMGGHEIEVNPDPLDLEALVVDRDEIERLVTPRNRELFLWGLGYGYKELAGITGMKMNTLKATIRRARLKL